MVTSPHHWSMQTKQTAQDSSVVFKRHADTDGHVISSPQKKSDVYQLLSCIVGLSRSADSGIKSYVSHLDSDNCKEAYFAFFQGTADI